MPGIDGSIKAGPVKVSGLVFYQTGTSDSTLPGGSDLMSAASRPTCAAT